MDVQSGTSLSKYFCVALNDDIDDLGEETFVVKQTRNRPLTAWLNMRSMSLRTLGDSAASTDRKKPQTNGSVGNKRRQCSSTESLTSTDELIAGSF